MSTDTWERLSELRETAATYTFLRGPLDLPAPVIRSFQELVLGFYARHGRSFPWRESTDPYAVVVSEVMLQQTQADRVVPRYREFLREFPSFHALAGASLRRVLETWSGLGYNRRARGLKVLAEQVVRDTGGNLPKSPEELVKLPMIGAATAASICAFAFDSPVVFVETNIRRVFIYSFFSDATSVHDRDLAPLVERTLYRDSPRTWYNALMDLGTALKSRVANPNRKSRHYARQSPFEGSTRQIRGRILRVLSSEGPQEIDGLADSLACEPERIQKAVEGLLQEEFLIIEGKTLAIREN